MEDISLEAVKKSKKKSKLWQSIDEKTSVSELEKRNSGQMGYTSKVNFVRL